MKDVDNEEDAEIEGQGEGEEDMEGGEEEEMIPDPEQDVEEMEAEAKINYSNNPDQMDTLPLDVDSFWRIDPTMGIGTSTPPSTEEKNVEKSLKDNGEEDEQGPDEDGVLKGQRTKPETDEKKKKNSTAKGEAKSDVQPESKDVMSEQPQKRRRRRKCEEPSKEKPDHEAPPAKSEAEAKGRDEEVHVPHVQDLVSDEETKDAESRAAFKDSYGGTWASWVYAGHFIVEICLKRNIDILVYTCTVS